VGAQQSLQSMDLRTVGRRVMRRSRRSIAVGSSIALVAGMTSMVGGAAMATPSPATPQTVASTSTVTPQSNNPACEPSTYVDVAAGFTYQAFTNLGDCDWVVPSGVTTVDYVVIAGGGSGGVGRGGGGGAGGMIVDDTVVSPGATLTLTVGDGGIARTGINQPGEPGKDSTLTGPGLGSITAQGGGGGGAWNNGDGSPGGSGGSGGGASGSDRANRYSVLLGGAGVPGQGHNGGRSSAQSTDGCTNSGVATTAICAAGGGGGAGGLGVDGGQNSGIDDTIGGAGGPGLPVSWIDDSVARNLQIGDDSGGVPYFAGGGGGGVKQAGVPTIQGIPGDGGVGGGGPGGSTNGIRAASGLAGTGSGGGGNEGGDGPAGNGGSGIIILRYASTAIPVCNPTVTTIRNATFDDTVLTFAGVGTCTWTPPAGLTTIGFLLVGGGGGGGAAGGGGGGGGGVIEDTGIDVSSGNPLTVTLGYGGPPGRVSGAGGAGATSQLIDDTTTFIAPGGSGGVSGVGGSGGSGGSGQGVISGGAGGSGAAGGTTSTSGLVGTAGTSSTISGTSSSFGGGGGGGISTPNNGTDNTTAALQGPVNGGAGGGGAGPQGSWDTSNPGDPGITGLGGGGGGGQTGGPYDGAGGRGGSGGLIIRYTTPLALASVNPASGPYDDTTQVTVTSRPGENFQPGATVDVGGAACVNVVITSPTTLTCDAPPAAVGTVDIQVSNGGVPGTVATLTSAYTYAAVVPGAPTISVAPGNTTASVAWTVNDTGGTPLTRIEFALDDTTTVDDSTTVISSPTQLSGLTNGQTYTVYARAVNSAGTGPWSLPAQVTPADPVPAPPTAPQSVRAVAGNASAVVSWSPPATAGSFPVTTYRVTGQPGGQGCLVAAPTLRCTVTGLTNGTTYTFSVAALTGAGWSPAATSNPVTPGGVTPTPDPVPVPEPLTPGQSLLLVDGVPDTSVQVTPNSRENGLTIEGDDWSMDLDGLGPDGKPLNLGPNGALILNQQRQVQTTGRGFLASSDVNLYIDPPVEAQTSSAIQGSALATGIYVGTLRTTRSGTFDGVVTLPAEIEPGEHILQVVGTGPSGDQRAMNLGVIVAPWIVLDQGTRKVQGRHDRIRTGGDTGGFEAGTRLTPWIRYSDQDQFRQGRATIRVQSDGSFTWTRKIRANRGLTAYVSFTETESNRVFWKKVR
jgi:hypothetical protein